MPERSAAKRKLSVSLSFFYGDIISLACRWRSESPCALSATRAEDVSVKTGSAHFFFPFIPSSSLHVSSLTEFEGNSSSYPLF